MQEIQEMPVQSLDQEDPLEGKNGNPLQYSCLGNSVDRGAHRLQSKGSQRDDLELLKHNFRGFWISSMNCHHIDGIKGAWQFPLLKLVLFKKKKFKTLKQLLFLFHIFIKLLNNSTELNNTCSSWGSNFQ